MIGAIKRALKKPFIRREQKSYKEKLDTQFVSYSQWIGEQEEGATCGQRESLSQNISKDKSFLSMAMIPYEQCEESLQTCEDDILLFVREPKNAVEDIKAYLQQYFLEHPEAKIVYGDEDEWNAGETTVLNPWFKPDWSPDTLESFFYFGSVVAIRRSLLSNINLGKIPEKLDWQTYIYQLVWDATRLCQKDAIHHVNCILYHSHRIETFGRDINVTRPAQNEPQQEELVSIVIPSKDNPEVLGTCIASIYKHTHYEHTQIRFEIIVVDNGSSAENQKKLQALQEKYPFQYSYEKCGFNFSKMCNQGADLSKGKYVLFLNDDMEVTQDDWLSLMVEKARMEHVGAVGAKLLYPNSDKIQHVGITNLRLGPVHKLQFHSDRFSYEFYRNRVPYNVLAVTGACLMVRKEVFLQAGGFLEELEVAFNDVELCFRIHKLGYFNVNRNDVTLYHHESLSRGNDDSKEKLERLHREKAKLYTLHPDLYGKDPYYSVGYTNDILDTNFSYQYQYAYEKVVEEKQVTLLQTNPLSEWENKCLQISLEYAGSLKQWEHGVMAECSVDNTNGEIFEHKVALNSEEGKVFFQGYAFVIGSDNSLYERSILLKKIENNSETIYELPLNDIYRPDVEVGLGDQMNCNLCGFAVKASLHRLGVGEYQVGVLAKDRCSRQRLLQWTNRYIRKG